MCNKIPICCYNLRGGIDVNMYNTLLEPSFALNVDAEAFSAEEEKDIWDHFDIDAYRRKILELAIPFLAQQLQRLPAEHHVTLVPGSASIYSPHDYSLGVDELRFTVEACSGMSEMEMQTLLDRTVGSDWNAEFGSHYRICEKLGNNYTIYDFLKPEGGDVI